MAATTLVDRALIRLSGDGVRDFMHSLVTQDVSLLAPDRPCWTGLLTPQGKALFDFILWADGDDILVDCEAAQLDALARRLAMYRLRQPIQIVRDESLAVHWSPVGEEGAADPRLDALGRRWVGPSGEPAFGWRAHRLGLGITEGIAELGSDKILWLECNAAELNGVSFTKGCYVGQENTARMHHRSKINRRLVVVPSSAAGERTRIFYPDLGLAVEHRRIDNLEGAIMPAWLRSALA